MPSLELRFRLETSALLRRRVDDDGFDCYRGRDDSDGDGDDAVGLAELDARETAVARDLSTAAATRFFEANPEFRDWSEERLRAREIEPTLERQAACGLVARSLAATLMALHEGSLEPPRRTQRMYTAHPDLFDRLSARDRLLPLTGESFDVVDRHRDPDLFLSGGQLVGFHPWLLNWPELIEALARAAETPGLRVSVAADPGRLPVPNVSRWRRLREEQLWGVPLTAGNVDSFDPKDQSSSFHAPVARHPLLDYSDPVLGTWIHARAEPPRRIFYVQEVLPADHEPYVHAGMLRIRALHSERDTGSRAFTHVDGKVESYPVVDWKPSRDAHPRRASARLQQGASCGVSTLRTGCASTTGADSSVAFTAATNWLPSTSTRWARSPSGREDLTAVARSARPTGSVTTSVGAHASRATDGRPASDERRLRCVAS